MSGCAFDMFMDSISVIIGLFGGNALRAAKESFAAVPRPATGQDWTDLKIQLYGIYIWLYTPFCYDYSLLTILKEDAHFLK